MATKIPEEQFETDVLIIGGGAAATMAAFECADAGVDVIQVTKGKATSGTTTVARGGFAAAMGKDDSPEQHLKDIVEGNGGELIDPELCNIWTHEIIDVVHDLMDWGAGFIKNDAGDLDLKMFPNHKKPRAIHHYDTTGNELTKTLSRRLRGNDKITKHSLTAIVDLAQEDGNDGQVVGAWGINYDKGVLAKYSAKQVILATGGGSGLFYVNDNPPQVTGDGYVMGFRAGVPLIGIEMIDFQAMCCSPPELFGFALHPTGFINAGAVFRNQDGEEFLKRYFPETAEKSTRSEVILAMAKEIHAGRAGLTGGIFMDATKIPEDIIQRQIPHIYKTCLHRGIDIMKTPLEVAPGSHTWLGGLKIDTEGRTMMPGLWAVGETGGGIHGGNRIGGSALSASMVFGRRGGKAAAKDAKADTSNTHPHVAIPEEERAWIEGLLDRTDGPLQSEVRMRCRMLAHENLGSIRYAKQCNDAITEYEQIENDVVPNMRLSDEAQSSDKARGLELESALSVKNLSLLGHLLATAELNREESRGAHYRLDFPEIDNNNWYVTTRLERTANGGIEFHTDPAKVPLD